MMNRKKNILVLMAVTIVDLSLYTAYELRPPTAFVTGIAQYNDRTFEEQMQLYPVSIHGKITDVASEVWVITSPEEDDQIPPNIISVLTEKIPKQKITIAVLEVYKNTVGIDTNNSIIVYDVANGIGENYDGERTMYYYDETIDHQVGDEGIFFISQENTGHLTISGFGAYYPILGGHTTVTTELDKLFDNKEIDLIQTKNLARSQP